MPSYLTPGIYMEEVDRGTKPIEAVGTAVAAFIGYTERASTTKNGATVSLVGKPTLVTNWSQYVNSFGGYIEGAYLPDAVFGYFANGGSVCYIVSLKTLGAAAADDPNAKTAAAALPDGKKKNLLDIKAKAGGPKGNDITVDVKADPADEGKESTSFTLVVRVGSDVKESYSGLTTDKGDKNVETATKQSQLIEVSVASGTKGAIVPADGSYQLAGGSMDTKSISIKDYQGDINARTGLAGLEPMDDVTMIVAPDLMSSYEAGEIDMKGVQAVQQALIDYCELIRYCFAILDAPPGMMPQEIKEWRNTVNYDSSRAALYYPWIEIADQTGSNGSTRLVPPSGHIAGVYARVDGTRGVHKAPANEIIRTVLGLEVQVTKGEQSLLNPIGVNCIRSFPGRGIRIWGARTLSSDASWRYVPVRRLFNMIEESIERGTQWVVFEPNDQFLWGRVRRDVGSFLKMVWGTGALFGASPADAFYVKCDSETNPPELRDLGQMVVEIGIAPVKPAEFVIFRISQWSPAAE
jgi:phage tail sheath protein FI